MAWPFDNPQMTPDAGDCEPRPSLTLAKIAADDNGDTWEIAPPECGRECECERPDDNGEGLCWHCLKPLRGEA